MRLEWPASFVPLCVPISRTASPARWLACCRAGAGRAGGRRRQAEKADRSKPMTIEADKPGSVDLQRQVVIFNGNVVISQGTMVMRADRVEVRERPDGYREAMAIGSAGQAGQLPPEARRRRRNRSRARPSASSTTAAADTLRFVDNAVVRRLRGGDAGRRDHRHADHLRQHQRGVQRHRRRRRRRPTRAGACARCWRRATSGRIAPPPPHGQRAPQAALRQAAPPKLRASPALGDAALSAVPRDAGSAAPGQPPRSAAACARPTARAWWSRTCTWPSAPARWSACSAPTAPARRPPST